MVVGGHSNFKEMKKLNSVECMKDKRGRCRLKPGLLNDVEVMRKQPDAYESACTKFVSPMFGYGYILGKDKDGPIWENEAELLGHAGVFAKDTAIICGGMNGDGEQKICYEWDFNVNRYVATHFWGKPREIF